MWKQAALWVATLGLLTGSLIHSGIVFAQSRVEPAQQPAADAACLGCHQEQAGSYLHTAHSLTSQLANDASLHASFSKAGDRLSIVNPSPGNAEPQLFFEMSTQQGRYFQSAITGWENQLHKRTEPIDLVIGSGKRGQTYLYWSGDRLFELPVSYWTEGHRWINSPGYDDGTADFSRPVNPGCLECHATFAQAQSADPFTNAYVKNSLIPGIGCQTCHGPGAAHVALETRPKPERDRVAMHAILNPRAFSRDRQVDLCALCHNGIQRQALAPAFSYLPGEPLEKYFRPLPGPPVEHPDVHGDQVGLLRRSRCYLSSPGMSCSTCHNTHDAAMPIAAYSAKCLDCHQFQSCPVAKARGSAAGSNCVRCHMPLQNTSVIVSQTAGKEVRAQMRSHWIKVYPEQLAIR